MTRSAAERGIAAVRPDVPERQFAVAAIRRRRAVTAPSGRPAGVVPTYPRRPLVTPMICLPRVVAVIVSARRTR